MGSAYASRPYQLEASVLTLWDLRNRLVHGLVVLAALVLLLGACAPTPAAS